MTVLLARIVVHKPEPGGDWLTAELIGPTPSIDFDIKTEQVSSVQVFAGIGEIHIWLAPPPRQGVTALPR